MKSGSSIVKTTQQMELVDITSLLGREIREQGGADGICVIFNPHTTAGLTINEGADPAVQTDIINGLSTIVPLDFPYRHLEGNSAAHIMASLMGSSLSVALKNGTFQLGTWQ